MLNSGMFFFARACVQVNYCRRLTSQKKNCNLEEPNFRKISGTCDSNLLFSQGVRHAIIRLSQRLKSTAPTIAAKKRDVAACFA